MNLKQIIENFSCSLGIPNYTTATILISLLVFGLGIFANMLIDWLKERSKKKKLKSAIIIGVKALRHQIEQKQKSFQDYFRQLDIKESNNLYFTDVSLPFLNEIKQISFQDFLSAFISNWDYKKSKNIKIENITRFSMNINLLNEMENRYVKSLEDTVNILAQIHKEWQKAYEDIGKLYYTYFTNYVEVKNSLAGDIHESINKANYLKRSESFLDNFDAIQSAVTTQARPEDIFILYDHFILPLQKCIESFLPDRSLTPLYQQILHTKTIFNSYENLRKSASESFLNYSVRYGEVHESCARFIYQFK